MVDKTSFSKTFMFSTEDRGIFLHEATVLAVAVVTVAYLERRKRKKEISSQRNNQRTSRIGRNISLECKKREEDVR